MDATWRFFFQNKTVSRMFVLGIFSTRWKLFSSYFGKLDDFRIDFLAKEVVLGTSSSPEFTLSRNSVEFEFSFFFYATDLHDDKTKSKLNKHTTEP